MSNSERDTALRDQERSNRNPIPINIGDNMADQISLMIRTADGTRKSAVALPQDLTIEQLLQATQQRWNLPSNTSYNLRLERTGQQLNPSATLGSVGLQANDVVEVLPNLEAGQK